MSKEPASEDFVDRAITAERALVDEKFRARDKAVEILIEGTHYRITTYISFAAAVIAVVALIVSVLKH